jgi:alkylhydroperoxidase/carboxymuconolactone decarboxylase family protein YurZ
MPSDGNVNVEGRTVSSDKVYDQGIEVRRAVLGDEWVDSTLKKRTPFNTEFQEMITRHVWGEIWTRPAIDHKTRRYMVMSMMIALHQWEEFKLHVRFYKRRHQRDCSASDRLLRSPCWKSRDAGSCSRFCRKQPLEQNSSFRRLIGNRRP